MIEPVTKREKGNAVERWAAKVLIGDGCWEFRASPDRKGYRRFRGDCGRMVSVHRFTYELLIGPIPEGLTLDHLCRNTGCCNPKHLEPVTASENTKRGTAGEWIAAKTHCPFGHEYTEENIYNYKGKRHCRECRRRRIRERDAKRRAK